MAQERIEIKFIPKGDRPLIKAIRQLHKETQKLNGQLNKLNKVNIKVAQTQDLVSKRVSANTAAVHANSTAWTRLQSVVSVYRNKMLLASFAAGLFGTAVGKTVKDFADFEDLERGFDNLGRSIDSSSEFLQKLRDATNNTVDDMELMKQANNAMMLGIVKSEEEMADLFDAAQRMGQALGRDVVSSIESLVTGMGRQSKLMLDNLGIIVDAKTAHENYAKANDLVAKSLTDAQKKEAFNQETLAQSGEILEKLGIEVLSTNTSVAQLQVASARLSRTFGEVFAPVLEAVAFAMVKLSIALDPRALKSLGAAVATLSAAYLFNAAVLTPLIPITLSYMMGIISLTGALAAVKLALIASMKAALAFTAALLVNPIFLAITAVTALAAAFYNFVFTQDEATSSLDDYQRKVLETNEANEEYRKSVEDNLEALEEELLLLNADNDLQRMAIKLKRDLTQVNYGLHDSEVALFNQIQARKEELKAIADEEKEELKRQKDIQRVLDEVANIHESSATRRAKANLKLLETEIELLRANFLMLDVQGQSYEGMEEDIARLNKLEAAWLTLHDQIQVSTEGGVEAVLTWAEILQETEENILEPIAHAFGQIASMAEETANARIAAIDKVMNHDLKKLRESRRFQKLSAYQQAKEEEKIREKAEKDKEKARKKANKLKVLAFRADQLVNVGKAIMNTAQAITAASAPGLQWMIPWIKAIGALQLGIILAQKPPKMEQGGLIGGRRHAQGGTLIEAERGEFVVSRQGVESVGIETLNRINEGGGSSNINIVFEGNVLSEDFIVDEAIPKIKEALRRGEDIGIS